MYWYVTLHLKISLKLSVVTTVVQFQVSLKTGSTDIWVFRKTKKRLVCCFEP